MNALPPQVDNPKNLGIFKLSLSEKIPASDLSLLIHSIDQIYFGHLWLDMAENTDIGVTVPDPYQPAEEETLYIRKLEIGTPNLIELIGIAPYLAHATAVVAAGFGIIKIGIKLVKDSAETYKTFQEIEKVRMEKAKMELETKILSLELVEKADRLYREGKISKEQFAHKNQMQENAIHITQNISNKIASEPEFTLIEKDEESDLTHDLDMEVAF